MIWKMASVVGQTLQIGPHSRAWPRYQDLSGIIKSEMSSSDRKDYHAPVNQMKAVGLHTINQSIQESAHCMAK